MNKSDMNVGMDVVVPFSRSNTYVKNKGILWHSRNPSVRVTEILDLSFCYELENEKHYELISNALPSDGQAFDLFGSKNKIIRLK